MVRLGMARNLLREGLQCAKDNEHLDGSLQTPFQDLRDRLGRKQLVHSPFRRPGNNCIVCCHWSSFPHHHVHGMPNVQRPSSDRSGLHRRLQDDGRGWQDGRVKGGRGSRGGGGLRGTTGASTEYGPENELRAKVKKEDVAPLTPNVLLVTVYLDEHHPLTPLPPASNL